jgi:hypothetical protein
MFQLVDFVFVFGVVLQQDFQGDSLGFAFLNRLPDLCCIAGPDESNKLKRSNEVSSDSHVVSFGFPRWGW